MLIVQKYGGSSVKDIERILHVAKRIAKAYKKGSQIIVVLSAQGDTTDELIQKAEKIAKEPSKRELDMLLATGEQQSVSLMAMALHKLGVPAVSLNAAQVGIRTTSRYGNSQIKTISSGRIIDELENKNIVVIAGFQGVNRLGDVTTLGRGGSDTTAVALAAKLNADLCEIYTDVDGVYTADPRIVRKARKLTDISYDEMLEMASLGAKVLHNRSVELAKKYNVNLVVRSSITKEEGTIVREEAKVERMNVSGVAVDKDVSRIALVGLADQPGVAFKIFTLLAKRKISVDIILQSIGRHNTKDISFTVSKGDLKETLQVLEENRDRLQFEQLSHDDKVAKLSVVGAGMATNSGVAALMFEALYDANVNIQMISTSEIRISVLIDEQELTLAANAVHDKFMIETSQNQ